MRDSRLQSVAGGRSAIGARRVGAGRAARAAFAALALAVDRIAFGADLGAFFAGAPSMPSDRETVSLVLDNDYFADSDDGYTGGFLLRWTRSGRHSPASAYRKPGQLALAFGQTLFTPSDLRRARPPSHDRAWAGWLFASVSRTGERGPWRHRHEASVGVVGPSSGADGLQRGVHRTIGGVRPAGWDSQIDDTATLQLTWRADTRVGLPSPGAATLALSPDAGVSVGNAQRHAELGATLALDGAGRGGRAGRWRAELGLRVRAVAHDLLLDERGGAPGRLAVEPWVGELSLGASWRFGDAELAYRHVVRTRQFRTQREGDRYGSVRFTLFR